MSDDSEPAWHAPWVGSLHWREWEGEAVVYQPSSGKTHYLNPLGACVLEVAHAFPGTTETIAERVIEALGLEPVPHHFASIADTLRTFEHLGLVEIRR